MTEAGSYPLLFLPVPLPMLQSGAFVVALSTLTFYIVPIPHVKVIIDGRHVNMR